MEKIVFAAPLIVGLVLILIGGVMKIRRIKNGVLTEGIITSVAKMPGKVARVKVDLMAPVVKYNFGGKEYCTACSKFYPEGRMEFTKGKNILIRVSRKNPGKFLPAESGGMKELLLIGCGVCIMLAYAVILLRYGI